jgi:hypothetical protein
LHASLALVQKRRKTGNFFNTMWDSIKMGLFKEKRDVKGFENGLPGENG